MIIIVITFFTISWHLYSPQHCHVWECSMVVWFSQDMSVWGTQLWSCGDTQVWWSEDTQGWYFESLPLVSNIGKPQFPAGHLRSALCITLVSTESGTSSPSLNGQHIAPWCQTPGIGVSYPTFSLAPEDYPILQRPECVRQCMNENAFRRVLLDTCCHSAMRPCWQCTGRTAHLTQTSGNWISRCEERTKLLSLSFSLSICSRYQESDFKLVFCWYKTLAKLHSVFPQAPDACRPCNERRGDILHIFWACLTLSWFWQEVHVIAFKLTNYEDLAFFHLHHNSLPHMHLPQFCPTTSGERGQGVYPSLEEKYRKLSGSSLTEEIISVRWRTKLALSKTPCLIPPFQTTWYY